MVPGETAMASGSTVEPAAAPRNLAYQEAESWGKNEHSPESSPSAAHFCQRGPVLGSVASVSMFLELRKNRKSTQIAKQQVLFRDVVQNTRKGSSGLTELELPRPAVGVGPLLRLGSSGRMSWLLREFSVLIDRSGFCKFVFTVNVLSYVNLILIIYMPKHV